MLTHTSDDGTRAPSHAKRKQRTGALDSVLGTGSRTMSASSTMSTGTSITGSGSSDVSAAYGRDLKDTVLSATPKTLPGDDRGAVRTRRRRLHVLLAKEAYCDPPRGEREKEPHHRAGHCSNVTKAWKTPLCAWTRGVREQGKEASHVGRLPARVNDVGLHTRVMSCAQARACWLAPRHACCSSTVRKSMDRVLPSPLPPSPRGQLRGHGHRYRTLTPSWTGRIVVVHVTCLRRLGPAP